MSSKYIFINKKIMSNGKSNEKALENKAGIIPKQRQK